MTEAKKEIRRLKLRLKEIQDKADHILFFEPAIMENSLRFMKLVWEANSIKKQIKLIEEEL